MSLMCNILAVWIQICFEDLSNYLYILKMSQMACDVPKFTTIYFFFLIYMQSSVCLRGGVASRLVARVLAARFAQTVRQTNRERECAQVTRGV